MIGAAIGTFLERIMEFVKYLAPAMLGGMLVLGGCASTDDRPSTHPQASGELSKVERKAISRAATAATLDAYKAEVAERIRSASGETFEGTLPEILKSLVVLDITLDNEGRVARVAVRRSNGFKHLEQVALDSVRKAGPFPAPSGTVLAGGGSVSYLETWLFRDDGKFQIRSLVKEPQPGPSGPLIARRK